MHKQECITAVSSPSPKLICLKQHVMMCEIGCFKFLLYLDLLSPVKALCSNWSTSSVAVNYKIQNGSKTSPSTNFYCLLVLHMKFQHSHTPYKDSYAQQTWHKSYSNSKWKFIGAAGPSLCINISWRHTWPASTRLAFAWNAQFPNQEKKKKLPLFLCNAL